MKRVTAIFPAGGIGARMMAQIHKPFLLLRGKPILFHTLEKFSGLSCVKERILVVQPEDQARLEENYKSELHALGVNKIVHGGKRRQDSVKAGLDAADATSSLVLVHDAVRPFVQPACIERVVQEAEKEGAAIAALPVPDTIKEVGEDGAILKTVPRSGLYLAQTPQCFDRKLLTMAFEKALQEGWIVTDEAQLLERMNQPVRIVMGEPGNIKITTPSDMALAEAILKDFPLSRP